MASSIPWPKDGRSSTGTMLIHNANILPPRAHERQSGLRLSPAKPGRSTGGGQAGRKEGLPAWQEVDSPAPPAGPWLKPEDKQLPLPGSFLGGETFATRLGLWRVQSCLSKGGEWERHRTGQLQEPAGAHRATVATLQGQSLGNEH